MKDIVIDYQTIVLISIVFLSVMAIVGGLFVISWVEAKCREIKERRKETKKETDKHDELVQYVFSAEPGQAYINVLSLIDSFINEAIETYFKIEAQPEDHYIDAEEAKLLNSYILASVARNITPSVRYAISLVYNIDTDEELTKLLKLRIKITLVPILVNVNKPI